MPQLDKITFLSQYFWLLIFFIGFFLYIQKIYIPRFGRILLYREKKLSAIDTTNAVCSKDKPALAIFDQISGRISGELVSLYTNFFPVSKTFGTESSLSADKKRKNFSQSLYFRYSGSFLEFISNIGVSIDPSTFYYGYRNFIKHGNSRRYGDKSQFLYLFFI